MEVLWEEKRPLLSSEIVSLCKDKRWKDGSIHILINSMLDKGVISIDGFQKTGKHYSRTFKPILTKGEFVVNSLTKDVRLSDSMIKKTMCALVQDESISAETLNMLCKLIQRKA